MTHSLLDLRYPTSALSPVISEPTLEIHHGKHHAAHLVKLDRLIAGTRLEDMSLEAIMRATAKDAVQRPVFNNAARRGTINFSAIR